jgi:hypothetical protein
MPERHAVTDYDDEWVLVPELCIYEEGEPPLEGVYRITSKEGLVDLRIAWRDIHDQTHSIQFGGPCDGESHQSDQPGIAAVSFTQVDELTLDSAAFSEDGTELMWARRRKSEDGWLLSTVQRLRREDGTTYSLTQVYRRAE